MVVMKRYLLVLFCLSLHLCYGMLEPKQEPRELKRGETLYSINVQDLPDMIGKVVVYKVGKSAKTGQRLYDKGILGDKVPSSPYYEVYNTHNKRQATLCCEKRLYYAEFWNK